MTSNKQCGVGKCQEPAAFNEQLGRFIFACERHRDERKARDEKRRKRKVTDQECMACDKPRCCESVYCEAHRKTHATRMKTRRCDLTAAGVCMECGSDLEPGSTLRCSAHQEQHRESLARIDRLSPEKRRHYASYCSMCGVYRVGSGVVFCGVCTESRTQCIEFKWHETIRRLAERDGLWPPAASTFSEKRALGTRECLNERLVYADMVWTLGDRVVVAECDEDAHADRQVECELARMDSMQFGTGSPLVPLIVLRFNPPVDLEDATTTFYSVGLHFYLTCDASQLPPLNQVLVAYHNYPADGNKHVTGAMANARFIVKTH